ncbi:MAG TPA: CBS domain-containing protein [Solirubrobacteraceae bacterium]|nr:CBS domain-containing protein [Solirubrobacteraceae bacterium]
MSRQRDILTPSLKHATVGDAMRDSIISCPPETSATKLARTMATRGVHCLFVMHSPQDEAGRPYVWGIVSDLDLMRAALRGDEETADSLASEPVITVKPAMPLIQAVELMVKNAVSHLVVVDPETLRPVGVLATTDVAEVLAWGER